MPIAAKFSEAFYQRFGHESTGELVDYLNSVDRTYRSELHELNDINWSRFESRLDQRMAQVDAGFARVDVRFAQLEAKLEQRLAELKAELLKWMFLFWVGTIGTVIALQRL